MEITIEWQKPVPLAMNNKPLFDEKSIPEELIELPGVYFFARWFGDTITPFYIGSSTNIRLRLRQHLTEKTFWELLEGRPIGKFELDKGYRYFHYGYFKPRGRQEAKRCIFIVEKQMIRQAMQAGTHLLNQRWTTIPTHTILFVGHSNGFSGFAKQTKVEA